MAVKLLDRRVPSTWEFLAERLGAGGDPRRWRGLGDALARAAADLGGDAPAFLFRRIGGGPVVVEDLRFLAGRADVGAFLGRTDPEEAGFHDPSLPANPHDLTALIEALGPFASRRLDEAVHRLYRSLGADEFLERLSRDELDELERACVRRLYGRGYSDVVVPYFRFRASEIAEDALWDLISARDAILSRLTSLAFGIGEEDR